MKSRTFMKIRTRRLAEPPEPVIVVAEVKEISIQTDEYLSFTWVTFHRLVSYSIH
jgi:hypothetical protein